MNLKEVWSCNLILSGAEYKIYTELLPQTTQSKRKWRFSKGQEEISAKAEKAHVPQLTGTVRGEPDGVERHTGRAKEESREEGQICWKRPKCSVGQQVNEEEEEEEETRIRQKFLQSTALENSSSVLKKQKGKGEEVRREKPRRRPGGERKRGRHLGSKERHGIR